MKPLAFSPSYFGYFVILANSERASPNGAKKILAETGIRITGGEGKRYLGAALGTRDFVMNYTYTEIAAVETKMVSDFMI